MAIPCNQFVWLRHQQLACSFSELSNAINFIPFILLARAEISIHNLLEALGGLKLLLTGLTQ